MEITTRAATPDDAPRLAELLDQLGYPTTSDEVAARISDWHDNPLGTLIVADVDRTVAGVAAVHTMPLFESTALRARLVALVVDTHFRRLGVGRLLVETAERHAQAQGCRDMEITSSRERTAAHSFYADMGYEDFCDRSARYLKDLASPATHQSPDSDADSNS